MRDAAAEIGQRLGRYRINSSREIKVLAERVGAQPIEVAGAAARNHRGWVVVATETDLWLARNPKLFGRAREDRFRWAELTAVEAGNQRATLTFGAEELGLAVLPMREHARLLDLARRRLGSAVSVQALRDRLEADLGRMARVELALVLERVPDRLEPGEHVELVGRAKLGFDGLLLVTDRRVLLLDSRLRNPREWSCARADVRAVRPAGEDGVELDVSGELCVLRAIGPPGLRMGLLYDL
jgi:hypothetical protein